MSNKTRGTHFKRLLLSFLVLYTAYSLIPTAVYAIGQIRCLYQDKPGGLRFGTGTLLQGSARFPLSGKQFTCIFRRETPARSCQQHSVQKFFLYRL